jgi:hypothetical protein
MSEVAEQTVLACVEAVCTRGNDRHDLYSCDQNILTVRISSKK